MHSGSNEKVRNGAVRLLSLRHFIFSWLKSNCWLNRLELKRCRHEKLQWRRPVIGLIPSTGPCATPSPGSFGCCEPSTTLNSTKLLWPMLYATGDDLGSSGGKRNTATGHGLTKKYIKKENIWHQLLAHWKKIIHICRSVPVMPAALRSLAQNMCVCICTEIASRQGKK